MRRKQYRYLLFLTAIPAFIAGDVLAQWKQVAPFVIKSIARPYTSGGVIVNHNGIVWVGYHDVCISTDLGSTWSMRTPFNGINNSCIMDISVYDDNIALATTQNGEVFITQDQGISWVQHVIPNPYRFRPNIQSAAFIASPNNIIACSYGGDRYITHDGGLSWRVDLVDTLATSVRTGNGGTAYISGGFDRGALIGSALYESHDFGDTWIEHQGKYNWDSYSFERDRCDTSYFYVSNEDVAAKSDNVSRMFISSDGGDSWISSDPHPLPYRCGSVTVSDHAIYMQTFTGVIRSTDQGQTWKDIGGPPNVTDTRFVTALDDNTIMAVDGSGSVWLTNNSGGDSLRVLDVSGFAVATKDVQTDTIGGDVAIPINFIGLKSKEDLELVVHYDTSLVYNGSFSVANVILDIPGQIWKGRSKLRISNAISGRVIGYSNFTVFVDSLTKPVVRFDSISVLTAIVPCHNLLPSTIFTESTITPPYGCGISKISRFMHSGELPQFHIAPNPSIGDISVISSQDITEASIEIFDLLGTKQSEITTSIKKDHAIQIASPERGGLYVVRIRAQFGERNLKVLVAR